MNKKSKAKKPQPDAPVGVDRRELNPMESAVVRFLSRRADGATLADIAAALFQRGTGKGPRRAASKAQANSWARNSVRRPLRERIIEWIDGGTYRVARGG